MQRRGLFALVTASLTLAAIRALHAQDAKKPFSPQELDQMLAPVALYPDDLLSQVLMAATYPLEVVEAARWSKANPSLKGDAAVTAVKDKNWDVSVMSLVAFPQVLVQLNDHLDWTQKLGDAMIGQQQDVADSIQRLRAKAADAGNLTSGKEQTVTQQGSGDDRTIVIAPSDPNLIYVPAYNPGWAYGAWPYPAYPPIYYPPSPGYGYGAALVGSFLFGAGIIAAGAIFGGWNWAGRGNSYVNVNVNRAVNINNNFDRNRFANNNRWQFDPGHRRGVAYRDPATSQRFGQTRPDADQRQQFRGRLEGNPGGGQIANRPQASTRPNLPQRPGGQQSPSLPNRGGGNGATQGPRGGGGLSGVNRGQQVNREAARGRAQQQRATSHGGGGGGARPAGGGGGTRPAAGGGGGRPGGGGQAGGGGRGGR
jgi:hypothetical protein